jgi:hypothetical protein
MAYILLKERIEYPFAKHFSNNWIMYCKDNKINQRRLLKTINKRSDYVLQIRAGRYTPTLKIYTFQLLANLLDKSIIEIVNYTPKNELKEVEDKK